MKKVLAVIVIIILLGSIFFLKDYVNPNPLPKTIWVEKDVSNNPYLRPNSLRDTVLVLSVKKEFMQVQSVAWGLLFNYRVTEFKAKFERCLNCEIKTFKKYDTK